MSDCFVSLFWFSVCTEIPFLRRIVGMPPRMLSSYLLLFGLFLKE